MNIPRGSLVALDTQILIWGGWRKSVPGLTLRSPADLDKEKRAQILLHDLDEVDARLIFPAVCVAELLCPVPLEHHSNLLAAISQRFDCPPFDLPASSLAAKLWQHNRSLSKDQQINRSVLKADVLIIATAKTRGARHFFSDDDKCRRLATFAGLESHDLPTHSLNLFTELEIKDKERESSSSPTLQIDPQHASSLKRQAGSPDPD